MSLMEHSKGGKATTWGGEQSFKIFCFHCGMPGLRKGGDKFCQWKDLSQAEAREKGLKFVTDALQGENLRTTLDLKKTTKFFNMGHLVGV
jgi:hypothetical protein